MSPEIGSDGVAHIGAESGDGGTFAIDEPAPPEAAVPEAEALPEAPLRAVLEALLFAGEEPATIEDLTAVLGEERAAEIASAVEGLVVQYERPDSGLRVQRLAGGFRITTDPALAPFLREYVRARNRQRLSRAALETLAVIAYKQPITAPEIQEIRGVNPSAILNALLARRLVRILGRKKVVGKPFLYGTTREFLIRFGLNSLGDLPSMEEFEAMIQPEAAALPFDEDPQSTAGTGPASQESDTDNRADETGASTPD